MDFSSCVPNTKSYSQTKLDRYTHFRSVAALRKVVLKWMNKNYYK